VATSSADNPLLTIPAIPFYFLRHGETDWNRDGQAQGHTNISLNDSGRTQARRAADAIGSLRVGTVVTSPLSRARETAEIAAETTGLKPLLESRLMEQSFGPNEGKAWQLRWGRGQPPPGSESLSHFEERVISGLAAALSNRPSVIIVGHGGVFRIIGRVLCGIANARCPNGFLMRFDPVPGHGRRWTFCSLMGD